MTTLLLAAVLGQCGSRASYGYARQSYYAAPTYTYAAPAQTYTYQQPAQQYYQAPQYNYSLVGDYMRQESAYEATVKQNAKLDALLDILTRQAAPVQQAPQPQPQFQSPLPSPQTPAKAPPQYEAPLPSKQAPPQFEAQYPSQQYPTEQQPPYGTKPPPSSPQLNPPTPSFESSSWVPPPPNRGNFGSSGAIATMTRVMQNRCVECHVGESDKGGGVKLLELDGQLARIDPYLDAIIPAVTSGRMPRPTPNYQGPLPPAEQAAIAYGVREYAARARAQQNVLASFGQ